MKIMKLYNPQNKLAVVDFELEGLDSFELAASLAELSEKLRTSEAAIKAACSHVFVLAYASAFKNERGSRKALFEIRDKIREILGRRHSVQFALGAVHFDYCLPTLKELQAFDWYASEPKKAKKSPVFGIDALKAVIENRLKKVKENKDCEGAVQELAKLALILKSFDEPVKKTKKA